MENENYFDFEIRSEVELNKIEENSNIEEEEYFSEITEETVKLWESILYKDRSQAIIFARDDCELLNEELNLYNQRVIKNDCDRTRVKDKHLLPSFREYIELLLTYYCRKNEIKYKQGMNEIIGPFVLLKSKLKMTLSKVYNLFSCFLEKFLTNYYYEDEFFSLQSSLALLNLLLKYHDPIMSNVFDFSIITPEMYATSWVLTMFANKTKLDVLYHLWDIIIKENDELFFHFFIIAFLIFNKEAIITSDHSQIPAVLSQLCLKTSQEVEQITKKARDLRRFTPFSFRMMARKLEIFKPCSTRLKELFQFYEPEKMLCLPVLPCEIFSIAYSNIVSCPDYLCKNFSNKYEGEIYSDTGANHFEEHSSNFFCFRCDRNSFYSRKSSSFSNSSQSSAPIPYILLDLRLSEEKNNDKYYDVKPGFLPMTVILDQSELEDENFADNLSDRFLKEKDKYHFIFITSETDYFKEYENKFYKEKQGDRERKKMMYGLQTRVSKVMNESLVQQILKKEKSKRMLTKIKEFDNLKNLIKVFMFKTFPHVSFAYGGFKEIHEQSIRYNIPLLNHDDNCYLCRKSRKKHQKVGFFSKLFKSEKNNPSNNINGHHSRNLSNYNNYIDEGPAFRKRSNDIRTSKTPAIRKETCKSLGQNDMNTIKSNMNNDVMEDRIIENINKIEEDNSNLFTIDDISSLITDPNYIVFTCLLIEYKHLYNKIENQSPQIMVFLNKKEIKIYKLDRGNKGESESLSFFLVETIKIPEIITIITRKNTKNIVTIQFTSELFGKTAIVIDLITDVDSKSFISKTKQFIEALERKR